MHIFGQRLNSICQCLEEILVSFIPISICVGLYSLFSYPTAYNMFSKFCIVFRWFWFPCHFCSILFLLPAHHFPYKLYLQFWDMSFSKQCFADVGRRKIGTIWFKQCTSRQLWTVTCLLEMCYIKLLTFFVIFGGSFGYTCTFVILIEFLRLYFCFKSCLYM